MKRPARPSIARRADAVTDALRRLRPLHAGDESRLQEFFRSHTLNTILERYGGLVATMTAERARELVSVDQTRDCALAIFSPDGGTIHAVGRYCLDPAGDAAEVALVVRENHRRQGLATLLLRQLTSLARARGLRRLWGQVSSGNAAMLNLFRRHGFSLAPEPDVPVVHATLVLS